MPVDVWSLLGMLLAVILILIAAWWVTSLIARQGTLKLPGFSAGGQNAPELCVLRQIPVGRSERLLLVRLHKRLLLLGAAQGGITLLTELTEAEAEPWLENASGGQPDFRSLLHMSTKK